MFWFILFLFLFILCLLYDQTNKMKRKKNNNNNNSKYCIMCGKKRKLKNVPYMYFLVICIFFFFFSFSPQLPTHKCIRNALLHKTNILYNPLFFLYVLGTTQQKYKIATHNTNSNIQFFPPSLLGVCMCVFIFCR